MAQYSNSVKKKLAEMVCVNKESTIKTANKFNVPLKTLEKWITAYNKNNHIFDEEVLDNDFHIINDSPINNDDYVDYDDMTIVELKHLLMKKDIELARLKKNYQVVKNGLGKKVFVTLLKKNMK